MTLAGDAGLGEKLVSEKPRWLCKAKGHESFEETRPQAVLTGLRAEVSQEVANLLDELHLLL